MRWPPPSRTTMAYFSFTAGGGGEGVYSYYPFGSIKLFMRVLLLLCHEVNKDCEWTIDSDHEDHDDDDAIEKKMLHRSQDESRHYFYGLTLFKTIGLWDNSR